MPYIEKYARQAIDQELEVLVRHLPVHKGMEAGQMNYLITKLLLAWVGDGSRGYNKYNEVMGTLECVKQELYRRVIAPYEDKKCKANGDVYV